MVGPQGLFFVDTSVAVALVVADHEHHDTTTRAVGNRILGLAGHAWFETFSVLTRIPPPARRGPHEVAVLLAHDFPATQFLSNVGTEDLARRLPELGLAGGAVYDALIGATAVEHGCILLSRDRRAVNIYQLLGASFELIG
ncbi:MAG: type II toxin-antitoxin system VapC family toxin [Acidimicrobiia bacterium]|nr:type II toxin-antitoxin system VapC family toxin [Acidimicrobiia bacterium]